MDRAGQTPLAGLLIEAFTYRYRAEKVDTAADRVRSGRTSEPATEVRSRESVVRLRSETVCQTWIRLDGDERHYGSARRYPMYADR